MANENAVAGPSRLGLRRVDPYWHEFRTNCKQRWAGRTLLDVFVTEFRDRTSEYYQWAIYKGYCRVNDCKQEPDYILKMSDQIQNKLHRHEAPITAEPIRILHRDDEEGRLVIVKPGSIPVHPAGRHHKTTLVEMLKSDHGIDRVSTSNRLDRLTSGIMICTTKKEAAHKLAEQFAMSKVRKAYVCRVKGKFPEGETFVEEPLLIVDRQTGVSIVHPLGKYGATIFHHMSYDAETDTSVVFCRPITGRTHQIRVHAQWLGHPIANDPVYACAAWDKYPQHFFKALDLKPDRWKVDPGSTLSVYGAQELDDVIADIKVDRDDREDWARWRDEMLFGRMLQQEGVNVRSVAGPNGESPAQQRDDLHQKRANGKAKLSDLHKDHFCDECQVPLIPDPKPEDLFIYLHAIKYETDEWSYQDRLPWWARRDWQTVEAGSDNDAKGMDGFEMPNLADIASHRLQGRNGLTAGHVNGSAVQRGRGVPLVDVRERSTPSMPLDELAGNHPPVVLEIFSGLEDVAVRDVQQRLREAMGGDTDVSCVKSTRHTAHVHVGPGVAAHAAVRLYQEGHINCAKDAYLEVAQCRMPQDILDRLANEKHTNHLLISKANHARKLQRKGQPLPEGAHVEDLDTVPTEAASLAQSNAESEFVEAMRQAWRNIAEDCNRIFPFWQAYQSKTEARQARRDQTFRATVDRSGYAMPTLTSMTFERELGSVVWEWLNGGVDDPEKKDGWAVDLKGADLDVTLKLLAGPDQVDSHWRVRDANPPGRFLFLFLVPRQHASSHRPPNIPNHLVHGGTALARYRGYLLSMLLPIPEPKGKGGSSLFRAWEPCAGSGSLAVELIAALYRRAINHEVVVSDLNADDIDKAGQMLAMCDVSAAKVGELDATDSQQSIDFVGGENVLDAIMTVSGNGVNCRGMSLKLSPSIEQDLPWGRRVMNHMSIAKLYPALMQTFCRVLKPGGAVLVMTADYRTLLRAIKWHEADARKRDLGWAFLVEDLGERLAPAGNANGAADPPADWMLSEEILEQRIRIVQCGYMVGIVLLRKVAIVS